MTIRSIRELPFAEESPRALFGIVPGRVTIDEDFEGFGWSRLPRLRLESLESGVVDDIGVALVIALHSASPDEDESAEGDLDLELRVGDEVLIVALSTFLAAWAPLLPAAQTWVLAVCNPGQEPLVRPTGVPAGVALWFGFGDVDAFADHDRLGDLFGFTAKRWKCL